MSHAPPQPSARPVPLIYLITDLELGGAPLVLYERARAIRDLGDFSPTVVSLADPGPVGAMLQRAGIPVLGLGACGVGDFPRVLRAWRRLLRQQRPAVVQSLLVHANIIAACGRRVLPEALYIQELHTTQERPRWHWWAQGRIARRCDVLLTPSRAVLDKLSRYGPTAHGVVIPNGVDVPRFRAAVPLPPEDRPWPASARVLGYVGRFDTVKNLDVLLHAVARLRHQGMADLHLALVGYGAMEKRLQAQAQRLGIHSIVHFCGPSSTPERWYKTFDIMCLPSWSEGFGMTLIEAMAAGTPIVAAATPAVREIVRENVDGTLVYAPTEESLTIAIKSVMNDMLAAKARAAVALQRITTDFSLERAAHAHNEILKKNR